MSGGEHPLSALITQGWAVSGYCAHRDDGAPMQHCFLGQKQGKAKVLIARQKLMGQGLVIEELEV